MDIETIRQLDAVELAAEIFEGRSDAPNIAALESQLNPNTHDVMSTSTRPDRTVTEFEMSDGKEVEASTKIVKVNRIPLALQELIATRATQFLFTNGVKVMDEAYDDQGKRFTSIFRKLFEKSKANNAIWDACENVGRYTEAAILMYAKNERLILNLEGEAYTLDMYPRFEVLSPKTNNLYPVFDAYGDMIAFGREYTFDDLIYQEIYTAEKTIYYKEGQPVDEKPNILGKIPVVFISQEKTEYQDVADIINRKEFFLSNFSDSNDYHAFPKIKVEGTILSMVEKGSTSGLIEMEQGGKADYMTYPDAINSLKYEFELLRENIYALTQTADISFDRMAKLGNVSGVALQNMFLDPYLKAVGQKNKIWDTAIQRLFSIMGAFTELATSDNQGQFSNSGIYGWIEPFRPTDPLTTVNALAIATGGEPTMSQATAMQRAGIQDPEKEQQRIAEEQARKNAESFL